MSTQFPTKTSEIKEKFDKFINKNLIDYSSKEILIWVHLIQMYPLFHHI